MKKILILVSAILIMILLFMSFCPYIYEQIRIKHPDELKQETCQHECEIKGYKTGICSDFIKAYEDSEIIEDVCGFGKACWCQNRI